MDVGVEHGPGPGGWGVTRHASEFQEDVTVEYAIA